MLKGLKKRLTASLDEIHADRLQDRYAGLDVVPIGTAPTRVPVKVGGEVQRMRMVPRAGSHWLEVVVSDGTGEVAAVFTGRRSIGGMQHGRGVVLEGVAHDERGRRVIMNPAYTLLA
ncbi:MAG: hypothetical protein AB7L13_23700 [Acidimicrobiia bacterium]